MIATQASCIAPLEKCRTGVQGLDEITAGGLPRGRPTLICGDAGSGKTILAVQFLVHGATVGGEPGVFLAFEESAQDLSANLVSLGLDLPRLCAENKLVIDSVQAETADIEEAGEYDLQGLFIRIQCAVDRVGARRIVLDSIEALFSTLRDHAMLRSELRRLFRWLKEQQLTALITGERGDGRLTRYGLEEYIADCVICLDHDIVSQVSTRHLRVVKYRGSVHGTNRYPCLIGDNGFSVFPITSVALDCPAPTERISSGVPGLNQMLQGQGFYRGSSILLSGAAGTGKTSLAAHLVRAACKRGERALFFAFEESRHQIIRNMRSIGIDLEPWMDQGLLHFHASRPALCGLEMHLASILAGVQEFEPQVVVLDPLTDFLVVGGHDEVKSMLTRLIDYLKMKRITALFTSLTSGEHPADTSDAGISSLIDTWLLVRNLEQNGERTRALYLLKSRGMAHSNQVREFLLTDEGAKLVDVCVSPAGVLTGTARRDHEAHQAEVAEQQEIEICRQQRRLERRRHEVEARIESLRRRLQDEEEETGRAIDQILQATVRGRAARESASCSRQPALTRAAEAEVTP
jgi:circadian clock protein KaiC